MQIDASRSDIQYIRFNKDAGMFSENVPSEHDVIKK